MGDEVKRVMSAATFYDIFGLKFGQFDEIIVRKEYRKLAIRLHPDKNSDPEATKAFQKVGEALQTLTDPGKRIRYDMELRKPKSRAPAPMPQQWPQKPPGGYAPPGFMPPPPPSTSSMYNVACNNCKAQLQVFLPNNYTPAPMMHVVSCPACGMRSNVGVPPVPLPAGMYGFPGSFPGPGGRPNHNHQAGGRGGGGGRGSGGGASSAKSRADAEKAAKLQKKEAEKLKKEKEARARKQKAARTKEKKKADERRERREAKEDRKRQRREVRHRHGLATSPWPWPSASASVSALSSQLSCSPDPGSRGGACTEEENADAAGRERGGDRI